MSVAPPTESATSRVAMPRAEREALPGVWSERWTRLWERLPFDDAPGWGISLGIHLLALVLLLGLKIHQVEVDPDGSLFTAFDDVPGDVRFDQAAADQAGDSAEVNSFSPTGGGSTLIGATVGSFVPEVIEQAAREKFEEGFKGPDAPVFDDAVVFTTSQLSSATEGLGLGGGGIENLAGSGGVAGAIDRLAYEIIQSLHEKPTTVIWLFDRSQSLKERRDLIADRFENVYRQLSSLEEGADGTLTTVVATYSDKFALLNERPTEDFRSLISKVRAIPNETETGSEFVFSAVHALATKYRSERSKGRNVMIFIITDEKGDDADKYLESTILLCRQAGIRVYVVGNAAPFGRAKGYVRWTYSDGFTSDEPVDAGPETVEPEMLSLGFWGHRGTDLRRMSSGYGPYALTRLCKETQGMYFIAQEDSRGRTFNPAEMRNYSPDYRPIRDYMLSLEKNKAKSAVVLASKQSELAAQRSNLDDLQMPRTTFRAYNDTVLREDMTEAQKPAAELEHQISQLVEILGSGEKDRDKVPEARWRAAYDLAAGRALAMKVRLYGYNQMLADMKGTPKPFTKSDSNEWDIVPSRASNAGQAVKKLEKAALTFLQRVIDEHPGTPWSEIAQIELSTPLGWEWRERHNPSSYPPRTTNEQVRRIRLADDERNRNRPRPAPTPPRERPKL